MIQSNITKDNFIDEMIVIINVIQYNISINININIYKLWLLMLI